MAKEQAEFHFPHQVKPHPETGNLELTTEQRIENGCAFLDHKLGRGWELLIDLDTFDINDGDRCVLGQVFGAIGNKEGHYQEYNYGHGIEELDANLNGAAQDLLFESDWKMNEILLSEGIGMDGATVSSEDWNKVIKARQIELVGSVEAATKARHEFFRKQQKVDA